MKHPGIIAILITASLLLGGCQALPRHKVHYTLLETQTTETPKKTLLMPLNISVMEMSTSGIREEVPEWTTQAKTYVRSALENNLLNFGNLTIVPLPTIPPEQQQLIEQHTALYQTVIFSALWFSRTPITAWRHKATKFDYTLGDGLSFLTEQTGADTALFISGEDVITTSGRKATVFLAAAFGVHIPLGQTTVVSSLVDLHTGNILWLNYNIKTDSTSLINEKDVTTVLSKLFEDYPGLEAYRKLNASN